MEKKFILVILFFLSCSPKQVEYDLNYTDAIDRYLFLHRLSSDSNKIDTLMATYLDSLKLDEERFKAYLFYFDTDLKFRQELLQKLTTKHDSTQLDSRMQEFFEDFRNLVKTDSIKEM